jgi:hypothetical protein
MSEILKREEGRSGESIPSNLASMIVAHQQPLTSTIAYASTDHSFSDSVFCSNRAKETTEEQGWIAQESRID